MAAQTFKRKLKVFLHCLFRFHKRGVIQWRRENETKLHYKWVCATCAPKQVRLRTDLTPDDIRWANELIKAHPEWRKTP